MPQPILAHISPTISASTASVALISSSGPIKCPTSCYPQCARGCDPSRRHGLGDATRPFGRRSFLEAEHLYDSMVACRDTVESSLSVFGNRMLGTPSTAVSFTTKLHGRREFCV